MKQAGFRLTQALDPIDAESRRPKQLSLHHGLGERFSQALGWAFWWTTPMNAVPRFWYKLYHGAWFSHFLTRAQTQTRDEDAPRPLFATFCQFLKTRELLCFNYAIDFLQAGGLATQCAQIVKLCATHLG